MTEHTLRATTRTQRARPVVPARRRADRLRRRGILGLVVAVLATLLLLCSTTTALADTPGNSTSDPHQTGCDANRTTVKSLTLMDGSRVAGYAYMRYSTSCQTQWLTVNLSNGYGVDPSVWIQNTSGTTLHESSWSPGAGSGTQWTFQLQGMRTRAGCAGAQLYRLPGWNWVSWNYLGCG